MHAERGSQRSLQIQLGVAAIGAVIILLGLFGTIASLIGLIMVVAGTVLSAPSAPPPGQPGRGWWTMLATGAGASVAGALISLVADTLGGLIAAIGGVLVVIAVALGFPLSGEPAPRPARRRW
jgi:hypothetical protein